MDRKPNINRVSNIYVLKGDFYSDEEFLLRVRMRNNLDKLWGPKRGAQLERELKMYCALLGNRQELVFGVVKHGDDYRIECRCYKNDCKLFKKCCPDGLVKPKIAISPSPGHSGNVTPPENIELPVPSQEIPRQTEKEPDIPGDATQEPIIIDFDSEPEIAPLEPETQPGYYDNPEESVYEGQQEVIQGTPDEKMLVLAGPGTGKTYSLIRKLEYLVDETRSVDADSILLLCFTRAAVREIRDRFNVRIAEVGYSDDLSRLDIRTFDSLATRILIAREVEFSGTDYDTRIQLAINEIRSDHDVLQDMRHFIVDEIQDLVGVRARFVQTILEYRPAECGFTLLGDHLQGIYDYQMKDNPEDLDAKRLLQWIREKYSGELKTVKLVGNRRQINELSLFSQKSRTLLETEREDLCNKFLNSIFSIRSNGREHNFVIPDEQTGRTAVLCRNNGEVLKISGYLRQRGIEHMVRRQRNIKLLPEWVAELLSVEQGTLVLDRFLDIAFENNAWDNDEAKRVFNILAEISHGSGHLINLTELRKYLAAGGPLPDDFYEHGNCRISVSTIHQSKGREYESVLVLMPRQGNIDEDVFEEAKVYYVAVTRAKNMLGTIEKSDHRTWLKRSERTDRFLELGRKQGGGSTVRRIEVGIEGDVDDQSFVDGSVVIHPVENQWYIKEEVRPGDRVEVVRDEDADGRYLIIHNSHVIGKMSGVFSAELDEIVREIYVKTNYRPRRFEEVYVDRIYSVVRKPETVRLGIPEPYFSSGVWYGVSLLGLGSLKWDTDH